jgi:asparagine synthase (glutamine-hydrolysing)
MCGIAGAFRIDGSHVVPLDEHVLRRMTDAIQHRGPDDVGLVFEAGLALGARRLSIVDVDGGHQPMRDESGRVWGAQNGEIYNHEELRRELRGAGHAFRTRCDTEVLPHLYEEHGPAMCERLRGKFAIAVWDRAARRGLIARDRLGVKPLYYAQVDDTLVFGSELKAVIASGLVSDELDLEAIAAYLTLGFVPAPFTPLKDVRKVMPGERLVIADGKLVADRYWEYPRPSPAPAPLAPDAAAQHVLEVLEESVVSRLMSDVPLGAMLSGGLDSSLIVALMRRNMDEPVKTFAVGFAGAGAGNELPDARRVAAALGADHHELELPLNSSIEDLGDLAWHLDEPLADLSSLGFLPLCGLAARHVTVALSGQGADELLGGYHRHLVAGLAGTWQRVPSPLRAAAAGVASLGPRRAGSVARSLQAPDPVARMLSAIGLLSPTARAEVFSGALAEYADAARRVADERLTGAERAIPLEAALYLEAQLGLVDDRLHYFDRASMAWSLEVRVPFLDHHVVEAYAQLPPSAKVRGREGKVALRRAARGIVPDFVLDKPKQGFFSGSLDSWLSAGARDTVDHLLLDDPVSARVLDPAAMRGIVVRSRAGDGDAGRAVLALVMLELWLREFLPRAFRDVGGTVREAA